MAEVNLRARGQLRRLVAGDDVLQIITLQRRPAVSRVDAGVVLYTFYMSDALGKVAEVTQSLEPCGLLYFFAYLPYGRVSGSARLHALGCKVNQSNQLAEL